MEVYAMDAWAQRDIIWLGLLPIVVVYDCYLVAVVALKCLRIPKVAGFSVPTVMVLEWLILVAIAYALNGLLLPTFSIP
jgi:hypothetical protein